MKVAGETGNKELEGEAREIAREAAQEASDAEQTRLDAVQDHNPDFSKISFQKYFLNFKFPKNIL